MEVLIKKCDCGFCVLILTLDYEDLNSLFLDIEELLIWHGCVVYEKFCSKKNLQHACD